MKFWNFKNETVSDVIELRIDGDIVDDDDAWIYEWLGIKAASPNAFRNELAQYAGKSLSVWIDSYGGSVFAATGIYNALMEHKKTGAKVTASIDSKAMSAATIIFMAGDERKISPSGIFMMHNPLTSASGYASDLRKAADVLDVVKDCIVNAYQLATGLSRNKIAALMDDETYMSARTAVKERFATEMLYVNPESPDTKQDSVVNFNFSRLAIQNAANASMKQFFTVAQQVAVQGSTAKKAGNEEENDMPINTIEDLQKEKPDLVNQVIQDAIAKERNRITALDALDDPQNAAIHEIVQDAKANGKTAEDIKTVVDIVKKNTSAAAPATNEGQDFMKKLFADNKASGVDGALATGANNKEAEDKQKDAAEISFMASIINKNNGRVK